MKRLSLRRWAYVTAAAVSALATWLSFKTGTYHWSALGGLAAFFFGSCASTADPEPEEPS